MKPDEFVNALAVATARALAKSATVAAERPRDEPEPMTEAEEAAVRRPSVRPDRGGEPWWKAYERYAASRPRPDLEPRRSGWPE